MRPEAKSIKLSPSPIPRSDSFETLIDSIPALVARIDCNMVIQCANAPFKKYFFTEEVKGGIFQLIIGPQVFQHIQHQMGKVLFGTRVNFQLPYKQGLHYKYLDVTLSPERDERSQVSSFVFHATDITEKLHDQHALQDYFENGTVGLHWVNAEGIIVWANAAELAMLGYTESEYIGHPISEFHKNKPQLHQTLARLAQRDVIKNWETELLCKDGSIRYVTINSSVLWEGDRFIHTRCFTIDITAEKLAAKAANESAQRFSTMADLVPAVIWTTDAYGQTDFINLKWTQLTGLSAKESLGEGWLLAIHPDDRENIRISWRRSFFSNKTYEGKFRIINAAGSTITCSCHAHPSFDPAGNLIGYTGIFHDISSQENLKKSLEKMVIERTEDLRKKNMALKFAEQELKARNRQLESTNKELSSFAHVASHDLQEPLRKIQIFSDRVMALEHDNLSERGKIFMDRIVSATNRMRAFIHDILAYSKTSHVQGKCADVNLDDLFHDVLHEVELIIEEKCAVIVNHGLPTVKVVQVQFRQLFLNLVSNALKFARPGVRPHIVVKCEKVSAEFVPTKFGHAQYYHISLRDNGIGFEQEYAEQIFEIFRRLHTRTEIEGTGIGLALCRKIVENHDGLMTAAGRVNEGATFHIYLPTQN